MSGRERENKSLGMWIHSLFWVTTPDNKDGVPLHPIAEMTFRLFFSNVPYDKAMAVSGNIGYWTHVGSMLVQRLRRWSDIKSTYVQRISFAGEKFGMEISGV